MKDKLGLYIHIPFCERKCIYCDFLSFVGCDITEKKKYIDSLIKEIQLMSKMHSNKTVDSIFIGGGTPSILEYKYIGEILKSIKNNFALEKDIEITIESNPGTVSKEKLMAYIEYDINRLSLGVQSFNDIELDVLGRIHTGEEAEEAFFTARKAGFNNINLDLMFAFPKNTKSNFEFSLDKVSKLKPEHISFYSLQIEEGTKMYLEIKNGNLKQLPEEEDRLLYHMAVEYILKNGYNHYEISNGALLGYECRHNLKYWNFDEYIGFGLAAHSFIGGKRFANTENMARYLESPGEILDYEHLNTIEDNAFEFTFTSLRKTKGLCYDDFNDKVGVPFWVYYDYMKDKIDLWEKKGLVILKKDGFALSLYGMDVSNSIMREFAPRL